MNEQRTLHAPPRVAGGPAEGPGDPSNAPTLLAQVNAFHAVARQANDNCEKIDAGKELDRRRNGSGE
jgi:hypothetical protein